MDMFIDKLKQRIKRQDSPLIRFTYRVLKALRTFDVPPIPVFHSFLAIVFGGGYTLLMAMVRVFYWKPVFIQRLVNRPKGLLLFGKGRPQILGPLRISMGDDCRLSAQVTLTARASSTLAPQLIIGDNVGIGWSTGIYVGRKIIIGDNVRIAGETSLVGYPGHPLDAKARAMGAPDLESQVGDIVLEDDVWLARGVKVMPGVTIGQGTIVASGAVVTKSLPAGVLAGGIPATVIRPLSSKDQGSPLIQEAAQ